LLKLGYNYEDIYNSINYNKDISSGYLDSNELMKDQKLIILYIQIFLSTLLKNIYSIRNSTENEINSLKGNLSALQSQQSSIKVENGQQNTKKSIKLNKNIENLNKNIDSRLEKLSSLNSEEQSINKEFERIRKLSFDELRELYFNK
jgi:septal ring factor EnvC (AmiA/AmiB activator)